MRTLLHVVKYSSSTAGVGNAMVVAANAGGGIMKACMGWTLPINVTHIGQQ